MFTKISYLNFFAQETEKGWNEINKSIKSHNPTLFELKKFVIYQLDAPTFYPIFYFLLLASFSNIWTELYLKDNNLFCRYEDPNSAFRTIADKSASLYQFISLLNLTKLKFS